MQEYTLIQRLSKRRGGVGGGVGSGGLHNSTAQLDGRVERKGLAKCWAVYRPPLTEGFCELRKSKQQMGEETLRITEQIHTSKQIRDLPALKQITLSLSDKVMQHTQLRGGLVQFYPERPQPRWTKTCLTARVAPLRYIYR